MRNTKKGFTLVELLVVIAILAVLATVSVVGYTSYISRTEQTAAETEAASINDAIVTALVLENPSYIQLADGTYAVFTRSGNSYTVSTSSTTPTNAEPITNIPADLVDGLSVEENDVLVYTSGKGVSINVVKGELYTGEVTGGGEEGGAAACEHTNMTSSVTAPTCTEDGYTTYTCECGHTETGDVVPASHSMVTDAAVPATCTTTGLTEGSHCSRCDNATTAQVEVPALGHLEFADDGLTCKECGVVLKASLAFDNTSKRTTFTTSKQVWEENGIVVTNDKASGDPIADYSNPVRFYKNSQVTVAFSDMKQITINCSSTEYSNNLKNSIGNIDNVTVTLNGKSVIIVFAEEVDLFVIQLTAGQVRMNSISVSRVNLDDEDNTGSEGTEVELVKYYLQANINGKTYYWNGQTSSGKGTLVQDKNGAQELYLENVTGGVYVYYEKDDGQKQYIKIGTTNTSFNLSDTAVVINIDNNHLYSGDRYIATYGTQDIRTYKTSNISGTNVYMVLTPITE